MAFVSGRPAALLLPALAALLLTAGCSPKKYGAVQFHSEPEEAEVLNCCVGFLYGWQDNTIDSSNFDVIDTSIAIHKLVDPN